MRRRIRVLVVDDAVVVRRLVTDALSVDPAIEIAGIAANGRIALQKIEQLAPDIVTLDVEMPEMDGLETISAIRARWPKLPVIMFSTLTERAARVTLEALTRGASDYVTKPANVGSVMVAQQRVRDELVPKIKSLCPEIESPDSSTALPTATGSTADAVPARATPPRVVARAAMRVARPGEVRLVVIGASTGGPNALAEIVPRLPGNFPVPVVIVQHMPPMFTRLLAERLNATSKVQVAEAYEGAELKPGTAWVAAGDHHLELRGEFGVGATARLALTREAPEHSCRPAVDVTFRSAARYGRGVLAVILTGMGRDGLAGVEAIRTSGGSALAQDEATSVVWGMPGFVVRAGQADAVLPVGAIGDEIVRRVCGDAAAVLSSVA